MNDFYRINEELIKYSPKLAEKPQIVVVNKMDLNVTQEYFNSIKNKLGKDNYDVYPISAITGQGLNELKYAIWNRLSTINSSYETFDEPVEHVIVKDDVDTVIVKLEEGKFIVEGDFIEKLLNSTNFDDVDSLRYFQNTLKKKGVIDKLYDLGVSEGDTVYICGYEFDFFD